MKKSIKLLSLFILTIVAMLIGKETVFAGDNAPATFKASTYLMSKEPLGLTNFNINVKKTTDGKYIYCYDVDKKIPVTSITYTKGQLITDPAIRYIIASGASDKTDNEFFATQSALWIYLFDNKQMTDTEYNYIQTIKNRINSSKYANDSVAKDIKNILEGAKKATSASFAKPTLDITTDKISFNIENDTYVSNVIKVNTNLSSDQYNVALYNQPKESTIEWVDGGFIIKVPQSSVSAGTTVNFKITINGSKTIYNVYKYTPSDSKYQNMGSAYPESISVYDEISATITRKAPTTVVISKQDITNEKELPGATLVIKNSKGEVVKEWVSTKEPMKIEKLPVGKYTLTETIAPEGYVLSEETIIFEVKEDGKINTVVMKNSPNSIVISKQDITTKKELPGATLVIKNSKGVVVKKWVSTNEPMKIEKLPVGKYTLTETIAPEGYVLSKETITFEVKKDGTVEKPIVMYNVPKSENVVSISKQDITTKEELPGATLIIRDSKGNEKYRWVSSEEPYIIKGIEKGIYTLEEIIAPEGYILSKEVITFEVNDNGVVTEVVMFNTPESIEIVVPPTGTFASIIEYILGGLVIMAGSVLIYKNVKKEQ